LLARRNGPGGRRFALQLGLLLASGSAGVALAARGNPAWIPALAACGVVMAGFFAVMHEAGHETAFADATVNRVALWLGALLMLQAPAFFREFHWEHHRSTQDPERDPEINRAPRLLDGWPGNPLVYLALASGQLLMLGKLGFTMLCALLPIPLQARVFPFVRPVQRSRVAWESRAVLLLLGGAAAALLATPGAGQLLWAWPVSHLALGLYLMPEHTGLPNQGSQLERTRTVRTTRFVRWLMWNMPYHSEHHAQPAVPFHALPRLHARLEPELVHVYPGYLAFHREALRRAFGRS
jgi:fatty acid desaturase